MKKILSILNHYMDEINISIIIQSLPSTCILLYSLKPSSTWQPTEFGLFSREHSAEVAHQPSASAKQWQGRWSCEEAGPQTQEEPRGEEERGNDDGLPERLRWQRCYTSGWDCGGGGWIHLCPCRSSRAVLYSIAVLCVNLCFFIYVRCRGFVMRACQAARCPSPVLQACRAAERRRARRVLTQYLCLHPWPSSSTACYSQTHRMTRWGEGGRHSGDRREG